VAGFEFHGGRIGLGVGCFDHVLIPGLLFQFESAGVLKIRVPSERFCTDRCRRQPNAIGCTRDQDLLVVHDTAIQRSGHAIKDLALDQVRANGASQQRLERCALTKSPPRRDLARRIGPGGNAPLPSWVARRRAIPRCGDRAPSGIGLLARERDQPLDVIESAARE
jgi:hypothetical protein